jgi:phosphoserine phosphatase RsbU/P
VVHSDGSRSRPEGGELPLGLLAENNYKQLWFPLRAGDTLISVSDGITESTNSAGDLWQEEGIEQSLIEFGLAPLEELPGLLTEAVDFFAAGAPRNDDMTVVALRIL